MKGVDQHALIDSVFNLRQVESHMSKAMRYNLRVKRVRTLAMKSKKMVKPSSASYLRKTLQCFNARIVLDVLDAIRLKHCTGPGIRARARDGILFGQLLAKLGFEQLLLLLLHPPVV